MRFELLGAIVFLIWPVFVLAQKYLMTQEAYDRAISLLKADSTAAVSALPGLRPGSAPISKLHPVGSYGHGTVVVFHGFAANAITSGQQAKYLYQAVFNVYAGNLPGFAQTDEYWAAPTLRDTMGYDHT